MQVRGPDANARNEFFLVYKADTDSGGNVVLNQIQLRGAGSTFGMNGVKKGVWYHVTMTMNFAQGTASATVQSPGAAAWASGTVTGSNNGNTNMIMANGSAPFYLDNIQVVQGATPAGQGKATIPAGQSSATITVTPVDDGLLEGDKTVQFILVAAPTYALGAQNNDVMVIHDGRVTAL